MTNLKTLVPVDMADKPVAVVPETPSMAPSPSDLDSQSVAGEEDPGASLSIPADSSASTASQLVFSPTGVINPVDEAADGTLGTAKGICCECGGLGRMANEPCAFCNGGGMVSVGLGSA